MSNKPESYCLETLQPLLKGKEVKNEQKSELKGLGKRDTSSPQKPKLTDEIADMKLPEPELLSENSSIESQREKRLKKGN